MASIKEVHEIIHSLDKHEKIQLNLYFNTFATKASNNYLSDYQCFNKIKIFDKEKIVKALNKVKSRKNLSESNTNLYNFILDSVIKINLNKDKKIGLLKEFQAIEFMFSKGLFQQSGKKLKLLKEEIFRSRNEKLQFYLFDFENELLLRQAKSGSNYNKRVSILDNQISFIEKSEFILKLRKIKTQLFALISTVGMPRTQEQLRQYLKLNDNDILKMSYEKIPKAAYLDFFFAKFQIQMISEPKETEKPIKYLKDGLELVKQNINIKQDYLPYYILSGMLMQTASSIKNENLAKESILEFKNYMPFFTSKQHQVASKVSLQTAYLLSSLNNNKINEGYKYLEQNKTSILDKENLIYNPHAYANYLSSARICFLKGDFNQSMEFIELLLDMKLKIRKSLLPSVYILYLLNHLKMSNTVYLPYAIRSLYKSFLKLGKIYEPEKTIITFLRKSIKLVDLKPELEKLYKKLLELKKDPFNNSFFGNADYIIWLENELKSPSNNEVAKAS